MSQYYDTFEVVTLGYRAPELLYGRAFGTPIDMWSLGVTLAELYLGRSLWQARGRVCARADLLLAAYLFAYIYTSILTLLCLNIFDSHLWRSGRMQVFRRGLYGFCLFLFSLSVVFSCGKVRDRTRFIFYFLTKQQQRATLWERRKMTTTKVNVKKHTCDTLKI